MRKLKMREKRWGHYYQTTPCRKKSFWLFLHDFLDFRVGVVETFGAELDELLRPFELGAERIEVELLVFHFLDDAFQFTHRVFVFDCFHNIYVLGASSYPPPKEGELIWYNGCKFNTGPDGERRVLIGNCELFIVIYCSNRLPQQRNICWYSFSSLG